MQISTQSRKRLLFAALFLAILVPLFFTLEIRSQLPLLGFEAGSPLIDWVHQNTTGSGFLRKVTGDATFYSLVLLAKDSRLGALLFFQSIVCAAIALVLLWLTLYCKKSYLTYDRLYDFVRAHFLSHHGRLRHQFAGGGILRPDALGRLSAGGARPRLGTRLSDCRRLLFCQPCVQPQGGVRRFTTFPQQRKNGAVSRAVFCFSVFTSASYS